MPPLSCGLESLNFLLFVFNNSVMLRGPEAIFYRYHIADVFSQYRNFSTLLITRDTEKILVFFHHILST